MTLKSHWVQQLCLGHIKGPNTNNRGRGAAVASLEECHSPPSSVSLDGVPQLKSMPEANCPFFTPLQSFLDPRTS